MPTKNFISQTHHPGWEPALAKGVVHFSLREDIPYILWYSCALRSQSKDEHEWLELLCAMPTRHKVKLGRIFEEGVQRNVSRQPIYSLVFGPPKMQRRPRYQEYTYMQAVPAQDVLPVMDYLEGRYPFDARLLTARAPTSRMASHSTGIVQAYEQKTLDSHVLYSFR